jgi:hypothetical protein
MAGTFVNLHIYCLYYDAVSSSVYVSDGRVISEY